VTIPSSEGVNRPLEDVLREKAVLDGGEPPKRGRGRPPGSRTRPASRAEEPAPVPIPPLVTLAGPTAEIMAPLYVAAGVAPADVPTAAAWAFFYQGWQAVLDHYYPSLSLSPWPAALLGTVAVALPVLPIVSQQLRRRLEVRHAASQPSRAGRDGQATGSPTRVASPAPAPGASAPSNG
jgi:hypothetical protein